MRHAEDVSLSLFGTAVTPSSLNLIVLAFSLVGVAMIGLGDCCLGETPLGFRLQWRATFLKATLRRLSIC